MQTVPQYWILSSFKKKTHDSEIMTVKCLHIAYAARLHVSISCILKATCIRVAFNLTLHYNNTLHP